MTVWRTSAASRNRFFVGALCVLAAGLSWSFTGIFLRLAPNLDSWQFLVWRSFGVACAFVIIVWAGGAGSPLTRFAAMGRSGALVVSALSLASIAFIIAMKSTTVANALFLSSCAPLFAAILGYLFLGERLSLHQAASVVLGFVGLGVIVGGAVEAGSLAGNISAVFAALGFAGASVGMRLGPRRDYRPAVLGYGIIVSVLAVGVCVVKGVTLFPPPLELLAAFAGGFLAMGVGFAFFLRGAPHVPAAGQTVLAQTETIFGPIWVWLAFDETPAAATLIGGAIILVAVVSMAGAGAGPPIANGATHRQGHQISAK
jgi:drug/metabolite transporter (DMT)-like permease